MTWIKREIQYNILHTALKFKKQTNTWISREIQYQHTHAKSKDNLVEWTPGNILNHLWLDIQRTGKTPNNKGQKNPGREYRTVTKSFKVVNFTALTRTDTRGRRARTSNQPSQAACTKQKITKNEINTSIKEINIQKCKFLIQ